MSRRWDSSYWDSETLLYNRPHERLRFMAEILAAQPGRRLLDVGCSAAVLKELLPEDMVYFGADISSVAAPLLPPGHFLQIDLNRTTELAFFQNKQIDSIHLGGVLEYLQDPASLLRSLRVLVPAEATLLTSIINFSAHRFQQAEQHHPAWVYKPKLSELEALMQGEGWKVEQTW
ncbi:MAG TPA: methyltransferase domain-containing protein, partial [Gemmatales bacterium]|nr:methyltransferase domain-containing protein [Gemmatales bacterium]